MNKRKLLEVAKLQKKIKTEAEEDEGGDDDDEPKQNRSPKNNNETEGDENEEESFPGYVNKQRLLVFGNRGISARSRHLLNDIRALVPQSKKESKYSEKEPLRAINDICEEKGCNNCVFFESKRHQEIFMWVVRSPDGPSAKFHLTNVHSLAELKMVGNCLLGSRPFLHFDKNFDDDSHLSLLKELFTQVFGTPKGHPQSKPFVDHIFCFYYLDNRVWFRNYQIVQEDKKNSEVRLVEIGPRFVLNLDKIYAGSFGGRMIYENPHYRPPLHEHFQRKIAERQSVVNRHNKKSAHKTKFEKNKIPIPELSNEKFFS